MTYFVLFVLKFRKKNFLVIHGHITRNTCRFVTIRLRKIHSVWFFRTLDKTVQDRRFTTKN